MSIMVVDQALLIKRDAPWLLHPCIHSARNRALAVQYANPEQLAFRNKRCRDLLLIERADGDELTEGKRRLVQAVVSCALGGV
jgi:hypothetical protein